MNGNDKHDDPAAQTLLAEAGRIRLENALTLLAQPGAVELLQILLQPGMKEALNGLLWERRTRR